MGMDLRSAEEDFGLGLVMWCKALELAKMYGWCPMGTGAPHTLIVVDYGLPELPTIEWNRGYWSNDYQLVRQQDGRLLGEAILDALDDIPDDTREGDLDHGPFPVNKRHDDQHPLVWFRGAKEQLRRLAIFVMKGEFEIW
jgi:hypothetical protein